LFEELLFEELEDELDQPHENFLVNIALTVTFLAGIVNMLFVTVISLLSESLTAQLVKL
jgi:hypothetical protein